MGSGAGSVKPSKDRMTAGVLAILLGSLGIHKFYLGYTAEGVIMLLLTLLTCGVGAFVMCVFGIIEGIMYLLKSDAEFQQVYVAGHRGWF